MTTDNHNLFLFWARTTHDKEHSPHAYHPLFCHMIDVAAVVLLMWEEVLPKATKKRIARALRLPTDAGRKDIENEEEAKSGWLTRTCSRGAARSVAWGYPKRD